MIGNQKEKDEGSFIESRTDVNMTIVVIIFNT